MMSLLDTDGCMLLSYQTKSNWAEASARLHGN
jgi:hypothetical protein